MLPATTGIYTLSLHDALPIFVPLTDLRRRVSVTGVDDLLRGHRRPCLHRPRRRWLQARGRRRSEEHTSELQSLRHLVCRLLLEKKKNQNTNIRRTEPAKPRRL